MQSRDRDAMGMRMRRARERQELSQAEVGKRLGRLLGTQAFSHSFVSKVESGKGGDMSDVMAQCWAEALGTAPGWLMYGDNPDAERLVEQLSKHPRLLAALNRFVDEFSMSKQDDQRRVAQLFVDSIEELVRGQWPHAPEIRFTDVEDTPDDN